MRRALFMAFAVALCAIPTAGNALIITDLGNNPNSATGHFSNSVLGTTFDDQFTFHLVGTQFVAIASATNDFLAASDFITGFTGQLFSSGANGIPGGGDDIAINIPIQRAVRCLPVAPFWPGAITSSTSAGSAAARRAMAAT
jgi:hypothetical protein